MVDEERYPPVYESPEVVEWRKRYLLTQELLRNNGMEFNRHYAGSTACAPSRTTLFTGQYPSLHGVSQTNGAAKSAFDPDMFWLDPNTVPTMGSYFCTAGYRTFYKGKWHISDADILIPGTRNALPSYNATTGVPDQENVRYYLHFNRLDKYGFSGWVGPEPHGPNPRNSGSSARIGLSGRDVVYAAEVVDLINALENEQSAAPNADTAPWLIVASFVNPHDIALYGSLSQRIPLFNFAVDDTVPPILPPPTFRENLSAKPRCQLSYRRTYGEAFQPLVETTFFRQLYYQLQKNVDRQMMEVFERLRNSCFYNDTIIIFTSDHGELLGAHGGLSQKWYCAYEEAIHVPLILHNPLLFKHYEPVEMLTSHVDILPTMLGLAGIDPGAVQDILRLDHTEVHPPVGRDLSALILGEGEPEGIGEPVYFMTDDDITSGLDQQNFIGWDYNSVIQPNHVETVIAVLQTDHGEELWKYSRYFDNPQFWTDPGNQDDVELQLGQKTRVWAGIKSSICRTVEKSNPVGDEHEMYNLTADPLETKNLADPRHSSPESKSMQRKLEILLAEQRCRKRLAPGSGAVPGMPPNCP
ncbi:MAG: sulfatase-like hydrolase/transferase [Firmicutes bacterium]|nr:sulfatase-like hydrolase/transferase [Bacillota bacterium]